MKLFALELGMKERTIEGFGERLCQIRKSRGMTQAELGKAAGVSNRVIAYYEQDGAQPPGAMLVDVARALRSPHHSRPQARQGEDEPTCRPATQAPAEDRGPAPC